MGCYEGLARIVVGIDDCSFADGSGRVGLGARWAAIEAGSDLKTKAP